MVRRKLRVELMSWNAHNSVLRVAVGYTYRITNELFQKK